MQYIRTPHEAELNAERVLRSWGYRDAVATTGGADGGIDVRSSKALAQVKWKNGAAGRPDIQRLYGARGTDHDKALYFFASSSYSTGAITYADDVDVRLFIFDPLGKVEPANRRAASFLRSVSNEKVRVPIMTREQVTFWLYCTALIVAIVILVALLVMPLDQQRSTGA